MNSERQLSSILPGKTVWIRKIIGDRDFTRRLMEMGMAEGIRIQCLYRSIRGDPTAYGVRGSVVALRKEDADRILVESLEQEVEKNDAKIQSK